MAALDTPWFATPLGNFPLDGEVDGSTVPPLSARHAFAMDALHEDFHEQTKYHRRSHAGISRTIRGFLQDPGLIARGAAGFKDYVGFPTIELPPPARVEGTLADALNDRRTTPRPRLEGSLSVETLSTLLGVAARVNRSAHPEQAPTVRQTFRPYPSAGGLFPVELYVVSDAVEGLAGGIAYYEARRHRLRPLPGATAASIRAAETTRGDAGTAPCAFVITAMFDRSVAKYGPRGYRMALIEAGHLMQNLQLAAAALGLPSMVSGSFYESEVEAALSIDGVSEAVLAIVFLGGKA